jgi:hypothetical protein
MKKKMKKMKKGNEEITNNINDNNYNHKYLIIYPTSAHILLVEYTQQSSRCHEEAASTEAKALQRSRFTA